MQQYSKLHITFIISIDFISHSDTEDKETDQPNKQGKFFQWPEDGPGFSTYYTYWMLIHKLYVCFVVVGRIAFEVKPGWDMVLVEFYMDVVWAIDLIRCFTQPYTEGTKLITD